MLVCVLLFLHTRPRMQRASGIPCALWISGRDTFGQTSGGSRRENAEVRLMDTRHCERSEAIQKSFRGNRLDCFVASLLAMTAASPSRRLRRLQPEARLDRLAHQEFLDLARHRHREFLDEFHIARNLVVRDLALAER